MIPRKIHFVWIGSPLPDWARHNMAEFGRRNQGYEVVLHGLDSAGRLADLAAKAGHPSSQADIVRLAVLEREGGWYFDVDTWPLRPLREAEDAWGLDDDRVFVSRQQHKVPINNNVIACGPNCAGIKALIEAALVTPPGVRCTYGPDLFSRVVARVPAHFVVASWPWFQPVRHDGAASYWRRALAGDLEPLRHITDGTGGQLPFALHLWFNGAGPQMLAAFGAPAVGDRHALVESCPADHPIAGIAAGLAAAGWTVRRYNKDNETILDRGVDKPGLLVAWNPIRRAKLAASAARHGVPCLWVENGFFERKTYSQVDHEGFLHWASWRRQLRQPAPEGSAARLARFYPHGLAAPRYRRDGYVMVLGQVPHDTQMVESEIQSPTELQSAVRQVLKELPAGLQVFVRPHPQYPQPTRPAFKDRLLPELPCPVGPAERRAEYSRSKGGSTLAEALAGARWCLAINSNAINEALAAGVPCLAFGPHLGIYAGVVRRTTVATLAADMAAMDADRYAPPGDDVRNYLQWLAARQYSHGELSQPGLIRRLLQGAGVNAPAEKASVT